MSAPALDLTLDHSLAHDVVAGLTKSGQKELPSTYLYDQMGSLLFDAITLLPEYGLTRADARLLERHSNEIAGALPGSVLVSELGSGSGSKTRAVLQALSGRRTLQYHPIDISPSALAACAASFESLPGLAVETHEASYLDGLRTVVSRRAPGQSLLVLFLGSTVGNFDPAPARAFLSHVRSLLRSGDALLLGTDLVKPVEQMLAAYDDSLGVTAAFNLNLLVRLNRELGAEFSVRRFEHQARWNAESARVEMHIRSRVAQKVRVAALDRVIRFEAGETIWTESSHKFRLPQIAEMAQAARFAVAAQWTDKEWPFAETLLRAV